MQANDELVNSEVEAEINVPDDFNEIRMILYGNAGIGKTELLSTLVDDPRTDRPLLIDAESGLRTVKSKIRRIQSIKDLGNPVAGKIDVIFLEEWKSLQPVYDFLFKQAYREQRKAYNCVIIDSLTELNAACVKHATGTSTDVKVDANTAGLREYMKTNSMMKDMIRAFRGLKGMSVFFTALPQYKAENPKDENSKVMIKPALVGKLADEAVAMVDYVGYLKAGPGGKRILQFQPDMLVYAKERSEKGKLINRIEAASADAYITMTMVLDAIEGKPQKAKTN